MQFTQLMEPVGESEYYVAQVRISGFKFNRLQKLLSQENSEKELLDIITESFEVNWYFGFLSENFNAVKEVGFIIFDTFILFLL